jgi:hypothetical protein
MTDNPFGLRIAVPADAAALLAFVLPIFQDDAAQPVSVPRVAAIVARCLERDGAIAGIVSGPDGVIEASVGASIDQFDYTDEQHCMVRWLGVAPAFRKSDRISRLMHYVSWLHETLAANSDRPIPVFLSAMATTEQRGKVLLYQRRVPMVGVLHAIGCLPERSFVSPGRAGGVNGGKGSRSAPGVHVAAAAVGSG